jgi:hypothetical protein
MDELGQAIVNMTRVIPKGVVCFLPSYAWLDNLRGRWAHTGVLDRIAQKKQVGEPGRDALDWVTDYACLFFEISCSLSPRRAGIRIACSVITQRRTASRRPM